MLPSSQKPRLAHDVYRISAQMLTRYNRPSAATAQTLVSEPTVEVAD
ncbi:MAG: hypothetical protein ABI068_11505 [Ktedonobacterales bacterium]